MFVDPVKDLGPLLLNMDKPARYTGGEYGRLANADALLQTVIAFPDLYEIGMSNQAFRIIYNGLNKIPGISCDRAFAPAPDFEQLLREKKLPLYGLDTGISLKSLDVLLFTLGYELGITGILTMLDVSGIPLRCDRRGANDPLVIAGGPAVSNPLPYSAFIDAFWMGEAEAGFFDLAAELLEIKRGSGIGDRGSGSMSYRAAMLDHLSKHPNVWVKGKEKVFRAVYPGFSQSEEMPAVYPIASMKTVQHHGVLEIMRGCGNGCRFCHAGYWYRPMRQKDREILVREADALVNLGGYREISLSSLSTGDYSGIGCLVDTLDSRFRSRHVSFQLPSLKVSTFSLSLLEKVSSVRKSGLTFAVETPLDFWQMAINKQVTEDSVVSILREAKKNGWRGAKFYFMIGLPVQVTINNEQIIKSEETEIVNFISNVGKKSAMHFNVNVGIFVPKPHTPYQWAKQIDSESAAAKLNYIRSKLKPLGHKVSVSDPLISVLEGILSRGNERSGDLVEEAFLAGTRLDPWQEYIAKDVWFEILKNNDELVNNYLSAKDPASPLPWQPVVSGVSDTYLRKELEKSNRGEMTSPCAADCPHPCGSCNENEKYYSQIFHTEARRRGEHGEENGQRGDEWVADLQPSLRASVSPCDKNSNEASKSDPATWKLLFSFTKEGSAVFHGHLSLIEIFSMAMNRAGLDVRYTQGFNPLAKLEIVSPLSVGIAAGAEIAAVEFSHAVSPDEFLKKMNGALPEGFTINRAECYRIPAGGKKHSLSSLLWGFGYSGQGGETDYVPAAGEKAYREKCFCPDDGTRGRVFSLRRACVLAKNIAALSDVHEWACYFDVYRYLYPAEDS